MNEPPWRLAQKNLQHRGWPFAQFAQPRRMAANTAFFATSATSRAAIVHARTRAQTATAPL
eukprot:8539999-Lingulodinium_polyedra.AAC.1